MKRSEEPVRWRDDPENRDLHEMLASLSEEPPKGLQERVWQRVRDPHVAKPKRRAPVVWAIPTAVAAGAAIALLLAAVHFEWGQESVGRFAEVVGHVSIARAGSDDFEVATNDSSLAPGATVETGVRSWARFESDKKVEVVAQPNTRFRTGTLTERESLFLDQGTIVVAVKGPKRARAVVVAAREYKVHVVGTVFSVTHKETGTVGVSVMEGEVRLTWPGGERRVRAGQTVVTDRATSNPVEARKRALSMLSVHKDRIVDPGRARVIGEETADDVAVGEVARGDVSSGKVQTPTTSHTAKKGSKHPGAGRHSFARGIDSDGEETKSEAERLFDRALSTGDSNEAIDLFDRVSKMKGPWAEVAAYRAARIASRSGLPDSEKRWKRLLKEYPRGKFAAEARLTLIESYMKARQFGQASSEISKFLSLHPRNERVGDVHFLKGEVARIRDRDCRSAIKDYASAIGSTRRNEDAMFWRAWCLNEIGDHAGATKLFESYLGRYPNGRHAKTVREFVE